jgi:hypothetical protein
MTRRLVLIAVMMVAPACGGDTATNPTSAAPESLELRVQTPHFRVMAGTAPMSTVQAAADRLEAEYPRVLSDLGVTSVPVVTVRIWSDDTTYFNELTRFFGVRYTAAGYITGPSEVRVLARPTLNVDVVHEFIHTVSLAVNPQFGNNPRWFWETVALFENGEIVNPRTLDYIVRGSFPTLQQLNVDVNSGTQIYQLGFVLGEFIVNRYGRASFLRLIQTSGDLQAVLGVTASEFEAAWQSYVRQQYLS